MCLSCGWQGFGFGFLWGFGLRVVALRFGVVVYTCSFWLWYGFCELRVFRVVNYFGVHDCLVIVLHISTLFVLDITFDGVDG